MSIYIFNFIVTSLTIHKILRSLCYFVFVQLRIVVSREGTAGEATVTWSLTPLMPTPVSADDVTSLSGVISFSPGSSTAVIVIEILSDDVSETDEEMILSLDSAQPSDTQRLRANFTQVTLTLHYRWFDCSY